ncbi:leucine-rich repeat domain-containing protein [Skeletonema marinoi]|uniref:Leucine-rich repeat domain-containing protein n=1 Tax=Skeletonema marinoi TaxID=267567 RepID=A0AAD8Y3T3_9STRA|nr:leucine-rich repeat domain-containing protein [Skeletonema marinoi]
MADHADGDGVDIFVYRGGRAPQHVTHVRIDKSVEVIEENAFRDCKHLVQETHDGIRLVGVRSFYKCNSLRRINLKHVVEIGEYAFYQCVSLESVEFGDNLETIGQCAFYGCRSLQHLNLPSIITIGRGAFYKCNALTDIELSERLETIEAHSFWECKRLQRIAIPLKRILIPLDDIFRRYNQFDGCDQLITVNLVGWIHKTVASLHMESWRNEMQEEIHRINQVLPDAQTRDKTDEIKQWMDSVLDKMDHYKAEHYRYVKEGTNVLELALWKAKLGEKEEKSVDGRSKKAKVDADSARKGKRITCGADVVIKNVLPFLKLD